MGFAGHSLPRGMHDPSHGSMFGAEREGWGGGCSTGHENTEHENTELDMQAELHV